MISGIQRISIILAYFILHWRAFHKSVFILSRITAKLSINNLKTWVCYTAKSSVSKLNSCQTWVSYLIYVVYHFGGSALRAQIVVYNVCQGLDIVCVSNKAFFKYSFANTRCNARDELDSQLLRNFFSLVSKRFVFFLVYRLAHMVDRRAYLVYRSVHLAAIVARVWSLFARYLSARTKPSACETISDIVYTFGLLLHTCNITLHSNFKF